MACSRFGHGAVGSDRRSSYSVRFLRRSFSAWLLLSIRRRPVRPAAAPDAAHVANGGADTAAPLPVGAGTLIRAYRAPASAPVGARFAPARFARLIARACEPAAGRTSPVCRIGGFFAPARAAKRSGPADAASFLPSQYGLRPVEVKYIFRYNSKLLDKSVFTSSGQPGEKAGIRHPKAQAYRLFSISGAHRTRPSRVRGNIVCELPKAIPEGRNTLDLVARLKVIHKMKTNALSRYAFCSIGVQRPHNWHPQIFSCVPLTSGCEVAESGVK